MDYLYIALSDGLVELRSEKMNILSGSKVSDMCVCVCVCRFDLGSGEGRILSSQTLLVGQNYTVTVQR